MYTVDQGELNLFCKDFQILIPKSKIHECYKKISVNKNALDLQQFKAIFPLLGHELVEANKKEIKYRLREIKYVLEYPDNRAEVILNERIEKLINEDDQKQVVNLKYKHHNSMRYNQAKKIEKYINKDQEETEKSKCRKIMDEIDKIMRAK